MFGHCPWWPIDKARSWQHNLEPMIHANAFALAAGSMVSNFWEVVVDVWNSGLFGISLGNLIISGLILVAFLLGRKVFSRFVLGWLRSVTKRTATHFDDRVLEGLEPPIRFIPVVLGIFLSTEYLNLAGSFAEIADNVNRSLIVFAIFWGLTGVVKPLSFLLHRLEKVFTPSMVEWLIKAIRWGIIFVGAATILEIWGIRVGPIIAGLGLLGVAVALGAQDLFKNLIAGLLILAEKRFLRGDWIRVDGVVEGTVESIGFRSTLVRRFDKAPVYVPNSALSDNAVTNFSAMTHRRIYWKIGLEYRTTVDQLRDIRQSIEEYVLGNPDFAKPPSVPAFVRVDSFGDSSIDMMLYCFTRTTDWGEWLKIKEEMALHIKAVVEGAGTGFAFPSRSLYVETVPGERPEVFVPPSGRVEKAEKAGKAG